MTDYELIEHIKQVRHNFIESLKDTLLYNRIHDTKQCHIRLCSKMRTTAGKAYYNLNMIKLNKTLFLENKDKFNQTIGHEIAHLLNYEIYGHTGHNGSWKAIMILLGLKPNRCHEYKVEKRRHKPKGYAYCHCRDNIPLKSKKYTNMIQGINYRCKLCDSRLILINESTLIHEAI